VTARRKVVLGQIGLGSWGPNLLRNFSAQKVCDVRRVCDLKKSSYTRLGLEKGGPSFTRDYREILADPEIEGVVVATPSDTHAPIGKEVLEAGKHLFVEKPFTLSSGEARSLCRLARKRNRIIMVGHLLMYHPGVQKLVKLVRQGKVGRIFFIGIRRRNLGRLQSHCNVLWDLGPHDISIALMVVGREPVRVMTTGQSYLQPEIPEVAFTTITFEGGVQAHIEESWLSPVRERELVVVGEKGMLVFDELSPVPLKFCKKAVKPGRGRKAGEFTYLDDGMKPVEVTREEPLVAECRHFLESILFGKEPASGGDNGLQVLRILEAADKSLRHGGRATELRRKR
jgi:predicted dehydrogenase